MLYITDIEHPRRFSLVPESSQPIEEPLGKFVLFAHCQQALADRAEFLRKKRQLSEMYGNLIRKWLPVQPRAESDIW